MGLIQFEIGLQSFNEKTLRSINRSAKLSSLCENIRNVLELGNIHTHIDLIVGLPYEDMESFKMSFNHAFDLKPHMLQMGFLKLLHGAELRERAGDFECEFNDTPPYEIVSNQWLNADEIIKLHFVEDVLEKMYNSRRFALTVEYLCSVLSSPFDMLFGFAEFLIMKDYSSLDKFTMYVLEYFATLEGVDRSRLRDTLALDRLATNKMGALPEFLKVKHPKIKKTLNQLDSCYDTKRPNCIKRAATPLLTENKLAYVDYDKRDYLTNRFLVKFTEFCDE